jgi:hypothetical protein
MSAVEPLFTHHAASDVLKSLFSSTSGISQSDAKATPAAQASGQIAEQAATDQAPKAGGSSADSANARTTKSVPDVDGFDVNSFGSNEQAAGEEQDLPQAEAKEISAEPSDNVHVDHFITQPEQNAEQNDELAHLTKTDLVHVLETFVNVLMEQKEKSDSGAHANLPRAMHENRDGENAFNEVIISKNTEIDELKTLLVEAQGTIITLLTDRVEDKAKLATLESQMRYLPDYQRLHTQPTPSKDSEELRADLSKVKDELQNIKNTAYKSGLDNSKRTGIKAWIARLTGSQG